MIEAIAFMLFNVVLLVAAYEVGKAEGFHDGYAEGFEEGLVLGTYDSPRGGEAW